LQLCTTFHEKISRKIKNTAKMQKKMKSRSYQMKLRKLKA
jgi:hypothetical protein